jgi:hypothetical protein
MIKFFRKIRYNLMQTGKTGKYFKYAIGEIVLVMIGILLALQVNNWNDIKNAQKDSIQFTNRLLSEVNSNLVITDIEITNEQNQINSCKQMLSMFNMDTETLNSRILDSLIYDVMTTNKIDINIGTLTEGLNTGKIALIQSDSLKAALYSFPTLLEEIKIQEQLGAEDVHDNFMPYLYDHFNYRQMDNGFSEYHEGIEPSKFSDHDNLQVLTYFKFENLIDNQFYNSNDQLRLYMKLKNEIEQIQWLIKQELDND